jgi:hypothetical protein
MRSVKKRRYARVAPDGSTILLDISLNDLLLIVIVVP